MKVINKYTYLFSVLLMLAVVSACDVIIPKTIEVKEEAVLEKYQGIPIKEIMTAVQKKFERANKEEIYFYSPNNFRTARTGLQAARAYYRNPEKKTYVLTNLYRTDKALDDAFEVKVIVQRELQEAVDLRDALDGLKAKKTHTREYRSLKTSLFVIIERIEKNKEAMFKTPEDRANFEEMKKSILADLDDFRLRVVKHRYLNRGELLVAEAESFDAKNVAPKTYAETLGFRDAALDYINKNVTNLKGVYQVAKEFDFSAQRLLMITREIYRLSTFDEHNTAEDYVLRLEGMMGKIGAALEADDLRNQTLAAQATQLSSAAARIVREQEPKQAMPDAKPAVAESTAQGTSGETVSQDAAGGDADQAVQAQPAAKKPAEAGSTFPTISGVPSSTANTNDTSELRKSIALLTDQIYQLTVEKNEWQSERDRLLGKVKKLQAQLDEMKKAQPEKAGNPGGNTKASTKSKAQTKNTTATSSSTGTKTAEPAPAQ